MITFITAFLLLIVGYLCYGAVVEKVFGPQPERKTPCYEFEDGVDYTPMATWKVFLIQFLNIAGTGPIFGAILGIMFGPAAYLWIVLGCIFGGAVHDYMSGMICMRKNGASLPEIIGDELGSKTRLGMRLLSMVLLILIGTVFAQTPATLLANMTAGDGLDSIAQWTIIWTAVIFAYYILATLLPIDKLIGKVYPLFGLALLIMAIGVGFGILTQDGSLQEITEAFENHHPSSSIPIFPGLCITIACGAVSGFHGTQSPMMARCLKNEKYGRPIFYGAMITEGLVALIWAAAAIKFADSFDISTIKFTEDFSADTSTPYGRLYAIMTNGGHNGANPAVLVNKICHSWLGTAGAILAILGVVAAPITSGDTALRSARLTAADIIHFKQNKISKRLALSLPIFAICIALMFVDFQVIWRYFAWTNQTLATFTLWAITLWLFKQKKCYWIGLIPAIWMTLVCSTYIFIAPEGLQLAPSIAYTIGAVITVASIANFVWDRIRRD